MPRKLNTFVHVVARDDEGNQTNAGVFGPDDTLPAWARDAITNPDVWAESPEGDEDGSGEQGRPPTSGAGSGRDAWAAYAASLGVDVTDDMDRGAIIAAVDARQ